MRIQHWYTLYFILALIFIAACSGTGGGSRCSLGGDCNGKDTQSACTEEQELNGECEVEEDPTPTIEPPGTPSTVPTGTLSCSTSKSKDVVAPNEIVEITLNVSGGEGPYTAPNVASFASTTKISRSYPAQSTSPTYDAIEVTDKNGKKGTCSFFVVVNASTSNTQPSCSIAASTASLRINQPVTFTLTMTGGRSPYIVDTYYFDGGSGFQNLSGFRNISTNVRALDGKYGIGGSFSTSFTFLDSNNVQGRCSGPSISVRNPRITSVIPSPSSTTTLGSSISLSTSTTDFSSAPTVSYTSSATGITITQSSNTATVTASTAGQYTINVTATGSNGDTATSSVGVTFNAPNTNIACALSYSPSNPALGQSVSFTLRNIATQASVLMTEFDGVTLNPAVSIYTKSYNTGGVVTARAKGRSVSGELCNNGADSSTSISVQSGLTCNAGTSPSNSVVGESVLAYMTPVNAIGAAWVTRVSSPWGCLIEDSIIDDWHSFIYFTPSCLGQNVPVNIDIQDALGRTATCSTTHWVHW